ncbi:D-mannonate epimerase [Candidatus Atribacteria bacterium RBG_16_35_8]|nr:MAG: D-mannonate epimerase [Candidatus Atribacteria bacterium RBG_16_35_8]
MENYVIKPSPEGITDQQIFKILAAVLRNGESIRKALILPPDITRLNSYAGPITRILMKILEKAEIDIMPATGTHAPMTEDEIEIMYEGIPKEKFVVHKWRKDVIKIGEIPHDFVREVSQGKMDENIDVEVNKRIMDKSYDIIISVGQIVPHEVAGMANYNKNIFAGCGGRKTIDASHYMSALYGINKIMGRIDTPVRKIFNYAEEKFLSDIPLLYILTVTTQQKKKGARLECLAAGRGIELFKQAAQVSAEKNITLLPELLRKVVVYLDPLEFKSTWLSNKAIYRTRMAIADGGELLIIAPGVRECGEDPKIDRLIRKLGYRHSDEIIEMASRDIEIKENRSVAAHCIHGSVNNRFKITYSPGHMTKQEVEGLNYSYMPLDEALKKYDVKNLKEGFNIIKGEKIFFISNPAIGLWAHEKNFKNGN